MKENIQRHEQHTLSHKRRAPLREIWKAVFWNANNQGLFIFCRNMSQFPKRPVLSAFALFLESCVCPPALPFRTWGQRTSVETGKCSRCLPWVNRKVFATNPGVLGLLPTSMKLWGEGNGNPLQYSCLENPRDGVAWWAAVYGVAQSWIRLKQLSSSSSSMKLCPSNPMTCEKGNTAGPLWLFAARMGPEAGILGRDTAPPVSSTVNTLYSSQLLPALSITSAWEMLVISWVLTLNSGLRISLRAQGTLTSGRAGTPVQETTSLVHHRAFVFYFILNFYFYRSIVYLQCFRYTAQWLSYIYPFSL